MTDSFCATCKGYRFVTMLPAGIDENKVTNWTQFTRPCPVCGGGDKQRLAYLRSACRVPSKFTGVKLADFRTTADTANVPESLRRALAANGTMWITLYGDPGVGKTMLLCAAVEEAIEANRSAVYVTMADLLDHLRQSFDPKSPIDTDKFWSNLLGCSVLAIDEVDRFNPTPWAREKFFELANTRYVNDGLTLFATNRPVGNGKRLLLDESVPYFESRVSEGVVIHVKGYDRRPLQSRKLELVP